MGLLLGVWQFNKGERDRVKLENRLLVQKDTIEFHRKLWLEKLDTYRSLVTLAGKISAAVNDRTQVPDGIDVLTRELTSAYWGQTVFVEDEEVADALRDFHQTVIDFQGGWADQRKVKLKADDLVQACRRSISKNIPPGGIR
jgi:hypothetical protein